MLKRIIFIIIICHTAAFACGCMANQPTREAPANANTTSANELSSHVDAQSDATAELPGIIITEAVSEPSPEPAPDALSGFLEKMTLEEKLYQMFFVTPELLTGQDNVTIAGEATKNALQAYPVGGLIYFAANIISNGQTYEMIKQTQQYAKIPLFIGVDEEGGRVARISANARMGYEKIPSMGSLGKAGDAAKAYETGAKIAAMLTELGFNVDFAPVADVLVNTANQEIGNRSFGTDAQLVAEMVSQVVGGLQENNISAVLKHFPGHGSTKTDSHTGYSESTRSYEEMRAREFIPFAAGIAAQADFVLISHLSAVNIDPSALPSTLSKVIITDMLINELQFKNIVITDSMSMGAVTKQYSPGEAAVMAVEAGVDMILMPQSLTEAYKGLQEALANGRLSEERIDESVRKIIAIKISRGII